MHQHAFLFEGTLSDETLKNRDKAIQEVARSVFSGIRKRMDRWPLKEASAFTEAYLKANDEETVTAILDDAVNNRFAELSKRLDIRMTRRRRETYQAETDATVEFTDAVETRDVWLSYLELIRTVYGKDLTFREIVDQNQLF